MKQTYIAVCQVTGKRMYCDKKTAKYYARQHQDRSLRAFRCDGCGYWHLGHQFGYSRQWHADVHSRVS